MVVAAVMQTFTGEVEQFISSESVNEIFLDCLVSGDDPVRYIDFKCVDLK